MTERRNRFLTPGAERVLRLMEKEEDGELVWSIPGGWWVGAEQVDGRCGMRLLRLVLIHDEDCGGNEMHHFTINEEGRKVLDDPDYVPIIMQPHNLKKLGVNPLTRKKA